MRTGIIWLQRARYHLENLRTERLAANDAVDYDAASQSVKMLDVLIDVLERSEQKDRRIKREKERQRREKLAANRKLVEKSTRLTRNTISMHLWRLRPAAHFAEFPPATPTLR
jgi:hypothetical protein